MSTFPVRDLRAWADGSESYKDRFRVERDGPIYDQAEAIRALLDVAEAAHRVEGNNGVIRNWRGLLAALARLDFGEGA